MFSGSILITKITFIKLYLELNYSAEADVALDNQITKNVYPTVTQEMKKEAFHKLFDQLTRKPPL
jgi:hypothetical protein